MKSGSGSQLYNLLCQAFSTEAKNQNSQAASGPKEAFLKNVCLVVLSQTKDSEVILHFHEHNGLPATPQTFYIY